MDDEHTPPEPDSLLLKRQEQDLIARMFGGKVEPTRFGHYEIRSKLGHGGMGIVFEAHDPKLDRKVAIKKLRGRGDSQLQRRLVREAQIMARLAHPNVVAVHEVGEVDGTTFIVMEYVEGVTLRKWLKQASRSRAEILTVFKAAALGLIAVHEKGLAHRDFKPDNVMRGHDGRVRVMDFGLARLDRAEDENTLADVDPEKSASQLTRSGAFLGTPQYMAPEQLRGLVADASSDQFGYCVSLYEALYGKRPFGGHSREERLSAIERAEIHEPPRNSAVPGWLRKIVVRGLEPRPEDRFESMRALLDALVEGELAEDADGREPPEYVFVSHDGVDKQVVRRLCEDLLDRGVRPWLDIWDLRPGLGWQTQMREALRKAPVVLVCHGHGGWNEQDHEFAEVLRLRIEADPISVYRVGLPGAVAGALPVSGTCEGVDLHEDGWDDAVGELVRLIGADRERRDWLGYEAKQAGLSKSELCPYRGLEAFKESDARWMFGRDEEIGELLELIRTGQERFLTVIGASGSGKSSLVMAGVCPALRNGALGDGRTWDIGYLRPGARPCEELAHALVNLQVRPRSLSMKIQDLREEMLTNSHTLCSVVSLMPQSKILLVVDQLEELFTEADLGRGAESAEAMAFIRNIVEATKPDGALWVVSTLRADFVQRCLEIGVLARALKMGSYFALPPMGERQIRAAVERPAKRAGFDVDARLVEKFVVGIAEQAGRLPLLQHVLRELWQRRDERGRVLPYEVYEVTGGLEGAIAVAAERALDTLRRELGLHADAVTRQVMTRLVHLGKGTSGDTRRRASLDKRQIDDATRRVLDVFVGDARVLVASEENGVEVFELAHEALLREWITLVEWLDADRAALRVRQELAKDAEEREGRRSREYLWGKGRLEEAKRILKASTVELGDVEQAFLDDSDLHARRRARLARGSVVAFMIVAIVVVAFVLQKNADLQFERDRAEEQTRLAQTRLDQAKGLAQSIIDDVLPRLERHPEVRTERKEILERLQEMLREIGGTTSDSEVQRQKMTAHLHRGDEALHTDNLEVARREYIASLSIAQALGEADPHSIQSQAVLISPFERLGQLEVLEGNLSAAHDYFRRSLAATELVVEAAPLWTQGRHQLFLVHQRLGDLQVLLGNLSVARDHFQHSLLIAEMLIEADPASVMGQRILASAHDRLGALELQAGNLSAARDHFQHYLVIADSLTESDPLSASDRHNFAVAHGRLGELEVQAGNLSAARYHFQRSLAQAESLAEADPLSAPARRYLAVSHEKFGDFEVRAGNLSAAHEHFQRTHEIAQALAEADPLNIEAQSDIAASHQRLGDLELQTGNLFAAREQFQNFLAIAEDLVEATPRAAFAQHYLAGAHARLGDLELQAGNLSIARPHCQHALTIAEALAKADPSDAQAQLYLSNYIIKLGFLENQAGNLSISRDLFQRAFAIAERLAETDPLNMPNQRNLGIALNQLAFIELQAGNLSAARDRFERSISITEAVTKVDPLDIQARRDLVQSYQLLGYLEIQAGNFSGARDHYLRLVPIAEALVETQPLDVQAQRDLLVSLSQFGRLELLAGNPSAAHDLFQRSLEIAEVLAQADPLNAAVQTDLAFCLDNLGNLKEEAGNFSASRDHYQRALGIRAALADANPLNAQHQLYFSFSLDTLGCLELQDCNFGAAREFFQRSLDIREVLAKANRASADVQFHLAVAVERFAELAQAQGDNPLAIKYLSRAQTILDDMEAQGQIEGYEEHEQLRNEIKSTLAKLQ